MVPTRKHAVAGNWLLDWVERGRLPDAVIRAGIRRMCARGIAERESFPVEARDARERELLALLRDEPIAVATDAANRQHYELPPEFFGYVLGPRRKYSGCYFPLSVTTLAQAEDASLELTCAHADLHDGQSVLELGCGWGSLTLWMAERYPNSRITAVSNSASQREYITGVCRKRGFSNVSVITADMNDFDPGIQFDRVVSVEMFEHMRNHERLMERISGWLVPGGLLFVHVFVHGRGTYLFETRSAADWMSEHFFTGGMMPGDAYLPRFQRHFVLEQQWRQGGEHYQRTADAWLANLDSRRGAVLPILESVYGSADAGRWLGRWRLFFMACAEMFGLRGGREWWVSHYLFRRRA